MYIGGNDMKIVVGGQMDKQVIEKLLVEQLNGKAEVIVKSDLDATMMVQSGQADYYVGACSTGAGGALAMAFGLLGANRCCSISTPGHTMSQDELSLKVKEGVIAFGFVNYDAEKVIPMILKEII